MENSTGLWAEQQKKQYPWKQNYVLLHRSSIVWGSFKDRIIIRNFYMETSHHGHLWTKVCCYIWDSHDYSLRHVYLPGEYERYLCPPSIRKTILSGTVNLCFMANIGRVGKCRKSFTSLVAVNFLTTCKMENVLYKLVIATRRVECKSFGVLHLPHYS